MRPGREALADPAPSAGAAGGRVAVVVITRDRRAELLEQIPRLLALPGPPRLVVVDNGSQSGGLGALRERHPAVTVIPLPGNWGAAGRNLGVRVADREFVAFADDDSWWRPGSLEAAVAVMDADPTVGLVAGRMLVGAGAELDPMSAAMAAGALGPDLRPSNEGRRAVAGCAACATVVRSRAFLSVGGFPPGFGVGGEEQLPVWDLLAAGWRAVYEPAAVAVHFPSPSRDPAGRVATVTRNDLWSAWARLPAVSAATRTAEITTGRPRGPVIRGAARALRGLQWPLARRAVLPAPVERARRQLALPAPAG